MHIVCELRQDKYLSIMSHESLRSYSQKKIENFDDDQEVKINLCIVKEKYIIFSKIKKNSL